MDKTRRRRRRKCSQRMFFFLFEYFRAFMPFIDRRAVERQEIGRQREGD